VRIKSRPLNAWSAESIALGYRTVYLGVINQWHVTRRKSDEKHLQGATGAPIAPINRIDQITFSNATNAALHSAA